MSVEQDDIETPQGQMLMSPCPFCGGPAGIHTVNFNADEYRQVKHWRAFKVICTNCGCSIGNAWYSKNMAVAAWNHRWPPASA